jgi:hypothetical protein
VIEVSSGKFVNMPVQEFVGSRPTHCCKYWEDPYALSCENGAVLVWAADLLRSLIFLLKAL